MAPVDPDLDSPPVESANHPKGASVVDDGSLSESANHPKGASVVDDGSLSNIVTCSGGSGGSVVDPIVVDADQSGADTTIHESKKSSAGASATSARNRIKRVTRRATKRWKHIVLTTTSVKIGGGSGGSSSGSTQTSSADTTTTELTVLKAELTKLRKESKAFKANVEKEFKGVKTYTTSTVTHFGLYWIIMMAGLTLAALYGYILFRAIRGSTTTFDALYVYSGYCGLYVVYLLMDVFWTTVRPDRVRCDKNTHRTHVMVAAHRAEESLAVMLPQVLQSFEPGAVWVCDNGYYDGGRTRELCERLGVRYRYNKVGNKANALLATGREIERDYPEVKNGALRIAF